MPQPERQRGGHRARGETGQPGKDASDSALRTGPPQRQGDVY